MKMKLNNSNTLGLLIVLTSNTFVNHGVVGSPINRSSNFSLDSVDEIENCVPSVEQIECRISKRLNVECFETNVIIINDELENRTNDTDVEDGSLLLNCTAPFPIDIGIEGFPVEEQHQALFVRNAENVFNEATFVYSVGLLYISFEEMRSIKVFKQSEPLVSVSFAIFQIHGNSTKSSKPENEVQYTEVKVGEEVFLPCISPNPKIRPKLYKQSEKSEVSFPYDVTRGFKTRLGDNGTADVQPGNVYVCYKNPNGKNLTEADPDITFVIRTRKSLYVIPNLSRVVLFENQELRLTCLSTTRSFLTGTLNGQMKSGKTSLQFGEYTSTFEMKSLQVGDKGKFQCLDEVSGAEFHAWEVDVLHIRDNGILQLRQHDNDTVSCSSSELNEETELQAIFCQGETNCKLAELCFDTNDKRSNISGCIKRRGGQCNIENLTGNCLRFDSTDPAFSQGMVQCRVGNYSYSSKFFRGFDGQLYLNWKDAPVSALIEVYVPPKNVTMYPHNSYPFGCRASPFISDGKIQWVIRGKDGSEILLHKKRVDAIEPVYHLDANLYTVRESNIRLIYPNDYDVLCMVPWWNATGSLRNHKRINVAAHVAPVKEIVISAACIIILLIIPLIYVMWRLKKAREAIRNLTEQEVEEFMKGDPTTLNSKDKDMHEKITATPYNKELEIPRDKLLIDNENKLGEGAFGLVLKGKVEGVSEIVAVKTVKPRCEVEQFKGFLSELKIMMHIGKHPFVVTLIGAHTDKIKEKIMYIVVEYCALGSLDKLLRSRKGKYINQVVGNNSIDPSITYDKLPEDELNDDYKNIEFLNNSSESGKDKKKDYVDEFGYVQVRQDQYIATIDLLRWSYEIASGMNYLAHKKVIHADLATRNILIHESGSAKITDFGLSRQLMNYSQYVKKHQEPLPWRWMAEESLRSLTFSSQSDVWAFGVTLWEIFTLGDTPYPGFTWNASFVDDLTDGLRMSKPAYAPQFLYDLMLNCWHHDPQSRPTFDTLSETLKQLMDSLNLPVLDVSHLLPTSKSGGGKVQENAETPSKPKPDGPRPMLDIKTTERKTVVNLYEN